MDPWEPLEDKPYGLLRIIHERFVCPLRVFREVCSGLDIVHTEYYQNFQGFVLSLVGPDPAMTGPGADSLLEKLSIYDQAEQEETGYGAGGGLSVRVAEVARICEETAEEIQLMIEMLTPSLIPTEKIIPIWTDELYISSGLGVPNEMHLVSAEQLLELELMGSVRGRWASYLNGLDDESISPATRLPSLLDARDLVMDIFSLPPVNLNPAQQVTLQQIMSSLAADGITGIPSSYIAALIADGFSQKDIMNAILAWHAQGLTDQQIADALFVTAFNSTLSSYYNGGIPYGFTSKQQFQDFNSALCSGLKSASGVGGSGYCVSAGVGGSAVTGSQYKRGVPFDEGRQSDYDIVLSDPGLLAKAEAMGIPTYDNGLRTGPLDDNELRELGLYDLERQLTAKAGRPVHFLLYNSLVDDYSRSPYITFFNSSCSC